MKEMRCKNCGSNDLKFQAGIYICEYCETEYIPDRDDGKARNYRRDFRIEDGVLTGYYGHEDHIEIPDGVTRVVEGCFRYISAQSIKCPKSLVRFDGTLVKCEKLESFEALGLKEISKELFCDCKSLKKVVLQSVITIPENAFSGCDCLREVIIPNAIVIGDWAFKATHLKRIEAPKVQKIGGHGLAYCNMDQVEFPLLEETGYRALFGCSSLKRIIMPNLKIAACEAFQCTKLESVDAPELERIEEKAFGGCRKLKRVSFPKVQMMGECAFAYCDELEEVDCQHAELQPNEKGWFNQFIGCPKLVTIKLSEKVNKKRILGSKKDKNGSGGCYIATSVYGSYDCPQVWTLRRYRDDTLAATWCGRTLIHIYYAVSPTLVNWFGQTRLFKRIWKGKLDKMVAKLWKEGVAATPYEDRIWCDKR